MNERSVLNKVKKLLNLSKGNANKHERDRAMEAAHKLLRDHNLEMSALDSLEENAVGSKTIKTKMEPWMWQLYNAVGILFFTTVLMQSTRNSQGRRVSYPMFIGRPENIAVSCEMAAFFVHSIRSEAKRFFDKPVEIRSFCLGATVMIFSRAKRIREMERFKSEFEAAQSLPANTTALACIHDKRSNENDRFVENLQIAGEAKQRKLRDVSEVAAYAGSMYGRNVNLEPPKQKRIEVKEGSHGR